MFSHTSIELSLLTRSETAMVSRTVPCRHECQAERPTCFAEVLTIFSRRGSNRRSRTAPRHSSSTAIRLTHIVGSQPISKGPRCGSCEDERIWAPRKTPTVAFQSGYCEVATTTQRAAGLGPATSRNPHDSVQSAIVVRSCIGGGDATEEAQDDGSRRSVPGQAGPD